MLARLVILAILVAVSPVHAEGWRHAAPAGYAVTPNQSMVQYLKNADGLYCLLGLYNPRPRTSNDAAELAEEWKIVVVRSFVPSTDAVLPAKTTQKQLRYVTRTATLVDGTGAKSYGELYVIATRTVIGSLLAVSATPETFAACRPAITGVLDSLVEPVMNQPSVMRTWGTIDKAGTGRYQYTIETDGTYRFRSERLVSPDRWILLEESGTWSIEPGRLTLDPTKATATDRTRKAITSQRAAPLERVTYAYELHYFERAKEWNLVLTPPKATARDGVFPGHASRPSSYRYSDTWKAAWAFWPGQ